MLNLQAKAIAEALKKREARSVDSTPGAAPEAWALTL